MRDLVAPELDRYIRELLPPRDPVIAEMERQAAERNVPIVGPAVATLLATLARSIGARRVFELGSAIGYSTAFFAQAVGPEGRVFYTDGSPKNASEGERLPLAPRAAPSGGDPDRGCRDAPDGDARPLRRDLHRHRQQALEAAAPRVRPGGWLLADNVLWSGRVVDGAVRDAATEGIRAFNRSLFSRPDFESVIVPLRDGVAIARKTGVSA